MEDDQKNQPRKGWAEAFQKMHEPGDDKLLIPDVFEDEKFLTDPENDWTWDGISDQSKKHT
jgi:antitoxin MazE